MGLLHCETDSSRFSTVVNMGKEGQISAVYCLLEAYQRLFHRKRTGSGHNALDRGRRSRLRWNTVAPLFSTVVGDNDALNTITSRSMHPADEDN
jgi:hypothetical protein